nr:transposase [Streptomyces sp. NBC_00830]
MKALPHRAFAEVRKVVYSTNMVKSINARLPRTLRNRGHFPSE